MPQNRSIKEMSDEEFKAYIITENNKADDLANQIEKMTSEYNRLKARIKDANMQRIYGA